MPKNVYRITGCGFLYLKKRFFFERQREIRLMTSCNMPSGQMVEQ
jgi:hypothetical protein